MSNKACCLLFIVSAPSGTGKTTVVERLVRVTDRLKLSRSYTSRAPRGDEVDGVDYNFVSRARFEQMIAGGEFLEYADVFGNLYGTHAGNTTRCLESGDDVVLVIDVQGARKGADRRAAARRDLRAAAVLRARSKTACAAAARTATKPSAGASRSRAKRSPRSRNTITSSSTMSSTRASSGSSRSCWRSARSSSAWARGAQNPADIPVVPSA